MLSDRVASFPTPEPDHWLPQPSVPLPGRSFLSSWARPFAQLLPGQLWGQGRPLGRDWSLLTRPDKGWVTTYKRWFLKDKEMETSQWPPQGEWGRFAQVQPPRKPLLHLLSPPQPESCPGLKEIPISRLLWVHRGCWRQCSVAPGGQM